MAYAESAVVVYLRAIFHPDGVLFPLKAITDPKLVVEVFREAATIFMLVSAAFVAGTKRWERFGYFMFTFAVWDIFYYIWLKLLIDWPGSIFDWDILFLIPMPWIGPVIAPVSISLLMIFSGILIIRADHNGCEFRPKIAAYILASLGAILILYSFMYDTAATFHQQMPKPYRYELLTAGDASLAAAFWMTYSGRRRAQFP